MTAELVARDAAVAEPAAQGSDRARRRGGARDAGTAAAAPGGTAAGRRRPAPRRSWTDRPPMSRRYARRSAGLRRRGRNRRSLHSRRPGRPSTSAGWRRSARISRASRTLARCLACSSARRRSFSASGIVLWIADPDGRELSPIVVHGYSPQLATRFGTILRDAENVTASAYRTGAPPDHEGGRDLERRRRRAARHGGRLRRGDGRRNEKRRRTAGHACWPPPPSSPPSSPRSWVRPRRRAKTEAVELNGRPHPRSALAAAPAFLSASAASCRASLRS